ncbi:hypothetical protein PRK78_004967 [Emydomyces testavorans]|uniref:BZIP domain-containing protein n=1 Tax=Emydomyces testavorans TaxID=2070801 RepID=A0AAF0DJF5_9EURO|nr:hypothetical protein PRK78_004967 [Emydomyces testavorans]
MSKRLHVSDLSEQTAATGLVQSQHEPGRSTPATGDSTPFQPPSRTLAVGSILNPPSNPAFASPSHLGSHGSLESPASSRASPSPSPSLAMPLSQTDPARFRLDRSVSPRVLQRRILTPRSPAARATKVHSIPGTMDVANFPFLQSPPPNTGAVLPSSFSHHSPSILPDQRAPQPFSHDTSPSTPHSSYSPFQQASPAHLLQPSFPAPPTAMESTQGLIPVTIDLDSGSKKAAARRKKNSCASKRFRQRKRAKEDEKSRIMQTLQDEIKFLKQAVTFYQSERNYFREYVSRVPGIQVPPRPASPQFQERIPPVLPQVSESESESNAQPQTGPTSSRMALPTNIQPLAVTSSGYQFPQQAPWSMPVASGLISTTPPESQQQFPPPFQPPFHMPAPSASPRSHDTPFPPPQ